jgi:hypothetical protein
MMLGDEWTPSSFEDSPMSKQITQLVELLEKMKCCGNCKYEKDCEMFGDDHLDCNRGSYLGTKDMWELK